MSTTAAKEVLSYCGSCKMDLMSTVVAKVETKIVKVQCKTCKKEHGFKQPKGVTEPGKKAPAVKAAKKSRVVDIDRTPPAKTITSHEEWTKLMSSSKDAKKVKYTPKARLQQGDVVEHPSFGDGFVMKIAFPNKAEILFETDLKVLIHSRE